MQTIVKRLLTSVDEATGKTIRSAKIENGEKTGLLIIEFTDDTKLQIKADRYHSLGALIGGAGNALRLNIVLE